MKGYKGVGKFTHLHDGISGCILGIGVLSRASDIANMFADHGFHYAGTYFLTRILGVRGVMIANICNIGFESYQYRGFLPGSYDANDIIAGAIGSLVGLYAHKIKNPGANAK